jgi:hypothetical protein
MGILLGNPHRIQRRINDTHVRTLGAHAEQIAS